MEKRFLGSSEIKVTLVGLGCNNFGTSIQLEECRSVIESAIDAGINFFDTADLYGKGASEDIIGQILGSRRKNVILATKFGAIAKIEKTGEKWGSCDYIIARVEDSLRRLRTDWIDLYQIHFPDEITPLEETLEALNQLISQGKVRAIGNANYTGEMITEAENIAQNKKWVRFNTSQNEWSLLKREIENDVVGVCNTHNISLIPYFPLFGGLLTGKYRRGQDFDSGTRF